MPLTLSAPAPKGGTGKTFTTANLMAALAEQGYRVLGVDLDPQADLSASWGVGDDHPATRVEQLLGTAQDAAAHTIDVTPDGYDGTVALLPSSPRLIELTGPLARERYAQLPALLESFDDVVDIVLIDTPAGITPFGRAALLASSAILTPMIPGYLEFRALSRLLVELHTAQSALGVQPTMLGVLFINTFDRSTMLKEYREHLRAQGTPVFNAFVRRAQRVGDHARFGQPTLAVEPDSAIAQDIRAIARELVRDLTPA
ncbi:MAG: chromosome partitioning protein [bacterium]